MPGWQMTGTYMYDITARSGCGENKHTHTLWATTGTRNVLDADALRCDWPRPGIVDARTHVHDERPAPAPLQLSVIAPALALFARRLGRLVSSPLVALSERGHGAWSPPPSEWPEWSGGTTARGEAWLRLRL